MKQTMSFCVALALALAACGSDGDDGLNFLVDVDDEPAGSNCLAGGSVITTGADLNGDGVLDADEVTDTSYVCADDGSGDQMVSIDAEPAGSNCEFGGTAIHEGVDTDGNGSLAGDEITETTYICGQESITDAFGSVIPGSVTVTDFLDLVVVAQFAAVEGNLFIEASAVEGLDTIDLSNLVLVEGIFHLEDNGDATTIDLSALTEVVGALAVTDALAATSIDLSALTTVGNDVEIVNTGTTATLSLSSLTTVDGNFKIKLGSSLGDLDLSSLTSIGETYVPGGGGGESTDGTFEISQTSVVGNIDLSGLTNLGDGLLLEDFGTQVGDVDLSSLTVIPNDIEIVVGPAVGAINLSALTLIGDRLDIDGAEVTSLDFTSLETVSNDLVRIENTSVLTTVSFPALTQAGSVEIQNNDDLTTVSAPLLALIDSDGIGDNNLEITDNPKLASVDMSALVAVGGDSETTDDFLINGNDVLTSITFTVLETVTGAFEINNSTLLCSEVDPVLGGLISTPDSVDVSGNAADCTP